MTTTSPSATQTVLSSHPPHYATSTNPLITIYSPSPYYSLALQIQHNLQHQHQWTHLQLHTHSPLAPTRPLPRPLISGLPPKRLYVHPDEQDDYVAREVERRRRMGGKGKKEVEKGQEGDGEGDIREGLDEEEFQPEKEWVLPTHLREKWSLRRMAEVFDCIGAVPPEAEEDGEDSGDVGDGGSASSGKGGAANGSGEPGTANKWRQTKRVVLATLDDDSTVVYYIVHDGIVKPRQN